jgi:hypothetical protein
MAIKYKGVDPLQAAHLAQLQVQLTIALKAEKTQPDGDPSARLMEALFGGTKDRDIGCGDKISYSEIQFGLPRPQKAGRVATVVKLRTEVPTAGDSFLKDAGKKRVENAILEDIHATLIENGIERADIKIDSLVESRASVKDQSLTLAQMVPYVNPGLSQLGTPFDKSREPFHEGVVLTLNPEELDETLEKLREKPSED